jgi:hypothetical protein
MKYSLRSLMTFSIRDLLWLTVVVALGVGWWVARQQAFVLSKKFDAFEKDNTNLRVLADSAAKERDIWKRATEGLQQGLLDQAEARKEELRRKYEAVLNSSAPAPNPPKD